MPAAAEIEVAAVRLLAVREHSRAELLRKLAIKGFETAEVGSVLDDLQARGLLSDERFAEHYVAMGLRKGYGPLRIRAELRERGVSGALITTQLDQGDVDWKAMVREVRDSKFGAQRPVEHKTLARQARFLTQRGFPESLVRDLLFRN